MLYDPAQINVQHDIDIEHYVALEHVLVSYRGDFRGLFEVQNEKRGLQRNIVLSLARFSAVPYLIAGSKMGCTMPDYLAYRFARTFHTIRDVIGHARIRHQQLKLATAPHPTIPVPSCDA